ncbi:hypothetical protein G7046_g445 [Stylonectria norvegica]|nr:hypothetical protein G7046_g445 [Stylonectria norvegica]
MCFRGHGVHGPLRSGPPSPPLCACAQCWCAKAPRKPPAEKPSITPRSRETSGRFSTTRTLPNARPAAVPQPPVTASNLSSPHQLDPCQIDAQRATAPPDHNAVSRRRQNDAARCCGCSCCTAIVETDNPWEAAPSRSLARSLALLPLVHIQLQSRAALGPLGSPRPPGLPTTPPRDAEANNEANPSDLADVEPAPAPASVCLPQCPSPSLLSAALSRRLADTVWTMSTYISSPPAHGDGELTSKRENRTLVSPDTAAQGRRQSLPAPPEYQVLATSPPSQDPPSTQQSTSRRPQQANSVQHAKDIQDGKGHPKTTTPTPQLASGLDPLTQRLRSSGRPETPTPETISRQNSNVGKPSNALLDANRERRKGPSFLSRMRGTWRKDDDMPDSESELGELRTDGTNARALTSVIGAGGGYIPLYKEPPRYIRVKPHNKKERDFNHLFLAQELMGSRRPEEAQGRVPATAVGGKILRGGDAIWAAEFSLDGQYLAVAGKDQMVRVFAVISTPEERRAHEEEEAQNGTSGERLSAPVFRNKPVREYQGHTGEVLALSWSKNNFLLSSSMDKTVRLWHMSRQDCLSTFAHKDLVTSIAFHPTDDRFFLAGSLDAQLRLWSIPDKAVAFTAPTNEFITAVAFTPDGKMAICGVLSGMCTFYMTEGLKMKYQIHVRSSRGKNSKGSKITGIRTMTIPTDSDKGLVKVLISSNDSRVRVYNLNDRLLQVKYKGLENQSSQIHARFSDDGKYIICGSEDRKAYIWGMDSKDNEIKDKQPYESFDAHPEVVTTALMAPTKTRLLLSASGDPIYDLCNPPPVMLRSLEETASQTAFSESEHDEATKRPEESPKYIERSKHMDGNIIITTDRTGKIKVFRQDCAYTKRQQGLWESGSKFSGRIAGVGRSGSIMTKTSGGSRVNSRRGSLNMGVHPVQAQHASERINSWRQDIDGPRASTSGISMTAARSERSVSPVKQSRPSMNTSAATLASTARKQPYASSPASRSRTPLSPSGSMRSNRTVLRPSREREVDSIPISLSPPTSPPTPSFSLISASDSESKEEKAGEGSFWNLSRWRGGISGLRNSYSGLSPGSGTVNSGTGGHTRAASEFLSPATKAAGRMSMAVSDNNRLKVEDVANRRKSAGPALTSRSPQVASTSRDNNWLDTTEPLTSKKRVDSGVGRMSAESTDSVQNPSC